MSLKPYASPHCHPFSFDSGSTPEAMCKREVELGSPTLTCTDHGSLAAVYRIYELAKKNSLIPIIGLEAYFRDDNCSILQAHGIPKKIYDPNSNKDSEQKNAALFPNGSYEDYLNYQHLTMHFMDEKAYLCAVKLLSKADERAEVYGTERKPLFDWNNLEELANHNVTVGSGCLVGMVQRHLVAHSRPDIAKAHFDRLHSLFKSRLYIEVFPHVCDHEFISGVFITTTKLEDGKPKVFRYYLGKTVRTDKGELKVSELAKDFTKGIKHTQFLAVKNMQTWEVFEEPYDIAKIEVKDGFYINECTAYSPNGDLQKPANEFVLDLAKSYNLPVLVSDDSHFSDPSYKIVQDVRLAQSGNWKFYNSYHRMSSDEAYGYFAKHFQTSEQEFEGWVNNSHEWAQQFKDFKFDTSPKLPSNFFPEDILAYTKSKILEHGRFPKGKPEYMQRLKQEIELLANNGTINLLSYFALIEEIARVHANNGRTLGMSRGSAGGTLLAYLLGITNLDPLKYNLSLDRFLTKDRIASGKLPDIDTDFTSRELLEGYETDIVEFEAEDGTRHTLPSDFKVETDKGLLTVEQALEQGADINAWWVNS